MAEDGTSKANEDLIAMWKEAEEANSTVNKMGTLAVYVSQNKTTLASKVKAKLIKVGKMLRKAKPRKKRTTMHPIVASTLKFHKDDDVDPSAAGSACRS